MEEECPYCGHKQQYQGDPMGEDETSEEECKKCKKEFTVVQCCSYWLDSKKIE